MKFTVTTKKWLFVAITIVTFMGSLVFGWAKPAVSTMDDQVVITIQPGMSTNDIGELLFQQNIIKSVILFRVVAKVENMENSLQAGEYAFTKDMSTKQVVSMISRGETAYRQITIPEGYTVDQIASLVQNKKLGDTAKFKSLAQNYSPFSYIAAKPDMVYKAEGYIFPDTYRVPRGTNEAQLLTMMMMQFDQKLTPEMRDRAAYLGLSVSDMVTLASLVEKEAKLDHDRPIIAGVFLNRLKQNMPLQSCATIQYILGYPKAELTVEDTMIKSPYNTYQHTGLPPGPIANPGIAAINAVLYPEESDYLYFVADKQGAHHFSRTYEEHLAAIEKVRN